MLNAQQKKVVEILDRPVIVTAGPGTGKTQTIIHKIEHLLSKKFAEESILVLTFSDKAAEELTHRIEKLTKKKIFGRTFHSFAQEIIEEYSRSIPEVSNKRILIEETDSLFFFNKNLEDFKLSSVEIGNRRDEIVFSLYNAIMKLKENGITPKNLDKIECDSIQTKIDLLNAYAKYENYKKQNHFLDFSDLLIICLNLIKKNEKIQEQIKNKYNYILVDEFQDVNSLQYEIVKNLSKNNNVTFVGDLKQSIYGFRGAKPNLLWDCFKKDFSNFENVILKENYRGSQKIVELTNKNIESQEEKISCNKSEEGFFNLYECEDENSQENFLLEEIMTNINSFKSVSVLFRTTQELFSFSKILEKNKIAHKTIPSKSPFEHPLIKEIFLVLEIISSPRESTIELFSLIESGPIHKETLKILTNNLSIGSSSLFEEILDKKIPEEIEDSEKEYIYNLVKNLEKTRQLYKKKVFLSQLIEEILDFLNIRNRISSTNKDLENLEQFVLRYEKVYSKNDIETFLKLANMSKNQRLFKTEEETLEGLSLITYHQAKGKEFDVVMMPTLNERRMPLTHRKTFFETSVEMSKKEFLEEEKRLFFVGLTRAKSKLYFSYVYKFRENKLPSKPSIFLENLNLKAVKYSTKDTKLTQTYNSTREIEEKVLRALRLNNFTLAKKHIDLMEKVSKKSNNLDSYLNKETQVEKLYKKAKSLNEEINFDHRKITYSVSQIQTYSSCPKKYLYQYVYRVPTKPKHYFDFGTSMHSILELLLPEFEKYKSKDKLCEIGLTLLEKKWISKAYESREQEQEYKEKGKKAIIDFIQKELVRKKGSRKNIQREIRIRKEIWDKKFVCIIDRVDKIGEELEVLDYKTSNSMEQNSKLRENIQLNVYAQAIKEEYGKYPAKASLWYLVHNKIDSIEITESSIERVKEKVLNFIKEIENKNFDPKPSSFGCRFCDFNKICKDSKFRS